jgi:hypothetical protein
MPVEGAAVEDDLVLFEGAKPFGAPGVPPGVPEFIFPERLSVAILL